MSNTLKVAYLSFAEVRKIRSRNVCQVICETDISRFRDLAEMDEQTGIFIPLKLEAPEGVYPLDVDPEEIQGLLTSAIGELRPAVEGQARRLPPSLAQKLFKNGYFFQRGLWEAMEKADIYTQDEHIAWVRAQEPILFYPNVKNIGAIEAHHVNRVANGAGKGFRAADWFTIPLTHSQHMHFHDHGTREDRERMEGLAVRLTADRMADRLKEWMGRESWSGVTEEDMLDAESKLGFHSGWFSAGGDRAASRR